MSVLLRESTRLMDILSRMPLHGVWIYDGIYTVPQLRWNIHGWVSRGVLAGDYRSFTYRKKLHIVKVKSNATNAG